LEPWWIHLSSIAIAEPSLAWSIISFKSKYWLPSSSTWL
jgi:hypothetical protein